MTTEFFILARAVHFGACLLFLGIFAFDRFVAASIFGNARTEAADYWQARIQSSGLILLPIILLSGLAWYVLVAVTMSGLPLGQAIQPEILNTIWDQTQFGMVWKLRLIFWLTAMTAGVLIYFFKTQTAFQQSLVWVQLLLGGLLTGSLAWAGHALEGSGWHLLADTLHLLVAAFWPMGLLPFALVLRRLRKTPDPVDWPAIATLVRRFSAISLGSVALLTITGLVNACYLVGSFSNLFEQTYGRFLLLKILLFLFAVAIGAVNLLRLKPRLASNASSSAEQSSSVAQLQFNVQVELFLTAFIIIVVAILGILPPTAH
ncbi:MAG TPA: CopD family protein [Verrucomicrobiae bacterium]|nr:CopD family protein [Verrucomicrobiae bacterium]